MDGPAGFRLLRSALAIVTLASGALACDGGPVGVRFAAIGDMGTGGPGQLRIAESLAARAHDDPIDFVVTVGDNFYPAGVLSRDDPQWVTKFEDVYADRALDVPFMATLGNHDHAGFPMAQVAYSAVSDRWTMPAPYYTYSVRLADGTEVAFFALDTERIRSGLDGQRDAASTGRRVENVRRTLARYEVRLSDYLVRFIANRLHQEDEFTVDRIVQLASRSGRQIDEGLVLEALAASVPEDFEDELGWLDERLEASSARWKIVYGHHPLYGHHPTRGHTPEMIDRVEPILVEHGVDLYIAGHDHLTDLMKPVRGVYYVTSGGGAGDDHPYPIEETDESYYVATGGGFTLFSITRDQIEVEAVDIDGVTRYTLVVSK